MTSETTMLEAVGARGLAAAQHRRRRVAGQVQGDEDDQRDAEEHNETLGDAANDVGGHAALSQLAYG
jgi:hypothetical protein